MARVQHLIAAFLLVALFAKVTVVSSANTTTCPEVAACDICQGDSTCSSNKCVCASNGKNNFNCYDSTRTSECHVLADPSVTSLNHHTANIHFFGSTKLVEMSTERPLGGKCDFVIYGWTTKVKGKFFLAALYFIDVYVADNGNTEALKGSVTSSEIGCETTYTYHAYTTPPFSGSINASATPGTVLWDGTPGRSNGLIYTVVEGGFFQVESPKCGYKFGLRTHHSAYPSRLHGFWFEVDKDYSPSVLELRPMTSGPLCLGPNVTHGENYTALQLETGIEDITYALIYYAYVNTPAVAGSFPGYLGPQHMDSLETMLRLMTVERRNALFTRGGFAFTNIHFIRCIADNDNDYSYAVGNMIAYFYWADLSYCNEFLRLANANCASQIADNVIPELNAFVAENCPPL